LELILPVLKITISRSIAYPAGVDWCGVSKVGLAIGFRTQNLVGFTGAARGVSFQVATAIVSPSGGAAAITTTLCFPHLSHPMTLKPRGG
jgi:hypothetical protein